MPKKDAIPDFNLDHKMYVDDPYMPDVTIVTPVNEDYLRERADYLFVTELYCPVRVLLANMGNGTAANVRVELIIDRQSGVNVVPESDIPLEPASKRDAALLQRSRPIWRNFANAHDGQVTVEAHADKFKVIVQCGTVQPKRR